MTVAVVIAPPPTAALNALTTTINASTAARLAARQSAPSDAAALVQIGLLLAMAGIALLAFMRTLR